MTRPVAVIIAAGPGVSGSLSRRMAREGYDLALVGHEEHALQTLTAELEELGASVGHRRRRRDRRGGGDRRRSPAWPKASAGSTGCTSTRARSARRTRCR